MNCKNFILIALFICFSMLCAVAPAVAQGGQDVLFFEGFDDYSSSEWGAWVTGDVDIYTEGLNNYMKLIKTGGTSCGLYQKAEWSPSKNLTNSVISIKIRTNLSSPVSQAVTARILTTTTNATDPNFTTEFTLPSGSFLDLPDSSAGWQTLTFNVSDLTYNPAGWGPIPRFDDIRKVEIFISYSGSAEIDLDNFAGGTFIPKRGLWVWSKSDAIIDDFNDNGAYDFDEFLSFIEAPHGNPANRLDNIYMACDRKMRSQPDKVRRFLADMNSRGFSIYVVISDPEFAIPDLWGASDPKENAAFQFLINQIISFQSNGHPNERFAGIMLDIEPHLLPHVSGWESSPNFSKIWATYINDLQYCRTKILAYNGSYSPAMTFSDAVASWYSNYLVDDIMEQVYFFTVMAYSDTKETIVAIADNEVQKAYQAGKECVICVETMNLGLSEDNITFWEEGHEELETALEYVAGQYAGHYGFGGLAIHMYADPDKDEDGYQHLTPTVTDKSPLITITAPNGVPVEGISFTDSVTISWTIYNPNNRNYNVTLSYKFQSQLDNDSAEWQSIYNQNFTAGQNGSSYVWNTSLSTSQNDRIIIKAAISYTSTPQLQTSDHTNFGVAINEMPDFDIWNNAVFADYPGYPQGLKIISDNNNVLHATYYVYYARNVSTPPGVYYSQSSDAGANWTPTHLTPDSSTYNSGYTSTWPRRPSISKYGDVIAIAWVEDSVMGTEGFEDKRIYLQINDNNGNPSDWLTSNIQVSGSSSIYSNVIVHVDSTSNVHVIWEASNSGVSSIEYAKYTYNSGSGQWTTTGMETVSTGASTDYVLRTPSVTTSAYGVHAIWGEYKKEIIQLGSEETLFLENFNSYPTSNWAGWGANGGVYSYTEGSNTYIRMIKDSSSARCGLYQKANWSPSKDLTGATISIDIRTNLGSSVSNSVTAEIVAKPINGGNYSTFSLPIGSLLTLPASLSGWQTLNFDAEDLTDIEGTYVLPDLTDVIQVKIRIEYTGAVNIDLDNFTAVGFTDSTTIPPEMRIVSSTRTTSWQSEQEVYTDTYENEQLLSGAPGNHVNYPVYFPKITAMGDYTYAVWQFTTVGTPGDDGLEQFSEIKYSKRDVSSLSNDWDTASTISSSGYAPAISVWNNSGTPAVQVVYANNFSEYVSENAYTGNLLYVESENHGATWSTAEGIASGSGLASGIRRPYLNIRWGGQNGFRAAHFLSYPFIFSDENGISTLNWINGGVDVDKPEEYYMVRGVTLLDPPNPPFANITLNEDEEFIGFTISWNPPDIVFAPTGYKLRRIANNNTASPYELNSGNPIHAIVYFDDDNILADTHYRYELAYVIDGLASPWSSLSNAVKPDTVLLIDDFELDASPQTYTGIEYTMFNPYITGSITDETTEGFAPASGDNFYKIVYDDNDGTAPGSFVSLVFPTAMNFTGYGSIKFNILAPVGALERDVVVQFVEEDTGEVFQIGTSITLSADGQWDTYYLFFDQVSLEVNGIPGAMLDLDKIKKINFVTWFPGSTTYYIDDITLIPTTSSNIILYLSPKNLTADPIYDSGEEKRHVMNQLNTPVYVYYGNMDALWQLRIYTSSVVKNRNAQEHIIKRDGLIRYDNATDTVYPEYTIRLKVWCENFGPPGFFKSDGTINDPVYKILGYPPVTNDYFFKGYDFDNDGDISGYYNRELNTYVEGNNPGQFPFDLDGDGFAQGDDFFTESDRDRIGEEPVWLFVPVMKHPTEPMDSDAIVMDPEDPATWRILSDWDKGSGGHQLGLYFAVFISEEYILNTTDPDILYGEYTNVVIVDVTYN